MARREGVSYEVILIWAFVNQKRRFARNCTFFIIRPIVVIMTVSASIAVIVVIAVGGWYYVRAQIVASYDDHFPFFFRFAGRYLAKGGLVPSPGFKGASPSVRLDAVDDSIYEARERLGFGGQFFAILVVPTRRDTRVVGRFVSFCLIRYFCDANRVEIFINYLFVNTYRVNRAGVYVDEATYNATCVVDIAYYERANYAFRIFGSRVPYVLAKEGKLTWFDQIDSVFVAGCSFFPIRWGLRIMVDTSGMTFVSRLFTYYYICVLVKCFYNFFGCLVDGASTFVMTLPMVARLEIAVNMNVITWFRPIQMVRDVTSWLSGVFAVNFCQPFSFQREPRIAQVDRRMGLKMYNNGSNFDVELIAPGAT